MNPYHLIDHQTTIFWFRRDLRIEDNAGLYSALENNENVLCLFIFDPNILDHLKKDDRRINFIHQTLTSLKEELNHLGTDLLTFYEDPIKVYDTIICNAVYTNRDYEPYAKSRDSQVLDILKSKNIPLHTFKDQVIFETHEVTKDDGKPYTVFTPYSKKWKANLSKQGDSVALKNYTHKENFKSFKQIQNPSEIIGLDKMGFENLSFKFPKKAVSREIIENYSENRDIPSIKGTSRLSIHIRFGTISIRSLTSVAKNLNNTWLNELIWRNFYHNIIDAFPHSVESAFKPKYDVIPWLNQEDLFQAWCKGETGYPMVDAGMRELNATGFMHNRVRMVTASFLTKHLLIDWKWGERYFAEKLLDFDLASNIGGWQWAAGSGCDAAPYFRVFNPESQMKKFDPEMRYIKKWIPEFGTNKYPKPIVEHKAARQRAINTYKEALNNGS